MAKTSNANESNNSVALLSADAPSFLQNMPQTARGSENVTAADITIPRLEICQSLSPCRKKNEASYIEGINEGDAYNNVTRQIYGTETLIVPVYFRKEFLIWKDRKEGGGFRGAHKTEGEARAALDLLEDGQHCQIVDTAQHFCLLLDAVTGKVQEIVLSMSKSKMKVSRKFNSLVRMNAGDSFSRVYRLNTILDKNDKGQDFFNFDVANAGYPTEAVYRQAESLYKSVVAGAVDVNRNQDDSDHGGKGPAESTEF